MSVSIGHTLVEDSDADPKSTRHKRGPHLFVLLEGERPAALSTRHSLVDCGSVALGRGNARRALRPGQNRHTDLELQIPDLRMSSRHAILTRVGRHWVIEDSSSRNGTRINGKETEQHTLRDGDLIEVGRSVLLFRADLEQADKPDVDADPDIQGQSEPVMTLLPDLARQLSQLKTLAPNKDVSILILGESGTGKEVLARQIHAWAGRPGKFVGVNCGAIAESLMESELFGSVKGAFSGASGDRVGLVRSSDRGCLFLDEIADLPQTSQSALLRVLQEHEVLPVGSTKPLSVDLRVLSATHQDLDAAVAGGRFRQDLFARIAGFRCILPPLRDRLEDLGLLIGNILSRMGDRDPTISPEAIRALVRYHFPLNIRELHSILSAAVTLAVDDTIQLQHLPQNVQNPERRPSTSPPPELTDEQLEHRQQVLQLLEKHDGNVSAIARETGKARVQVQRWLKRYNIDAAKYRT